MERNEKAIFKVTLGVFVVLLLPMVVLSFYNVPSADDYTFGRMMYHWIQENGFHIPGMLACAVRNSIQYYFNWQGRYSESFFASFMPDIYGMYWISALIILAALISAVWYLFHVLIQYLAGKKYIWISTLISAFVCIAITQRIPSAVEGIYWFDGAQAYMLHHALYIWMCALNIQYFFIEKKSSKKICMLGIICLTILVAGGNNVSAFVSILTYVALVVIAVFLKKKRELIIPFLISVAGFMVSYLSPGTVIRGGDSSNYTSISVTVLKCFRWTLRQYLLEWTTAEMLIMLLVLTPFFLKIVLGITQKHNFKFPYPLLAIIGSVCFISAMSSPAFYVLGESGPLRMRNVIYVNYVLLLVINYVYLLGWLVSKQPESKSLHDLVNIYNRMACRYGVMIILGAVFWLGIGDSENYGTSLEAAKEIVSGQAAQYHKEAMERKELYMDENLVNIEVKPYSVTPRLLFFDDITDDENNWKNRGISEYYGKESIILDQYVPYINYD